MPSNTDRDDDRSAVANPLVRLRAGREPGDDLAAAVVVVVVGMLVPLVVASRYEPHLELYSSPQQYVALAAFGFGLASWLVVEGLDLDRVTFVGTAIIAPWLVLLAVLPLLSMLGFHWVDSFAIRRSLVQYPVAIGTAGTSAVVLSLLTEQLSVRHSRAPGRRTVAFSTGAVAVLGVGTVAAARYASPPAASIDDVDVEYSGRDAEFFVALEAESTAFHVAITAPDGTIVRKRVRDFDLEYGPMRIVVPQPEDAVHRGRFDLEIVSNLGATIDSASVTVDNGSMTSIRDVETETDGSDSNRHDYRLERR
ncbi:hypothetical protein [Natronorubrum sp. DTA28]|uniref:hypothetical protein n=1 Tax=Natronorubrum sp. DTA28 TaxID=3447019 RepID=UPI003F830CB6